jgi:ribosomal protein L7/L12
MRRKKESEPLYPYDDKRREITLPEEVVSQITSLLKEGKKIPAVQRVLPLTGAGLKISKDYVDELEKSRYNLG